MRINYIYLLLIITLILGYTGQSSATIALDCQECSGWTGCLQQDHKDFFTTGRSDKTNWDMAIWENTPPEIVRSQSEYAWINGVAVSFSVSYNPADGKVTYTVGSTTINYNYAPDKLFGYIIPFAKGDTNNNVELTELTLKTNYYRPVCDVITSNDYRGVRIPLSDAEQSNGFTITGKAKLIWATTHPQEIPAFHILAMNTHEIPTAITLTSFDAVAGNRQVTLNWKTAAEIDTAGYNIYRSQSADGDYALINAAIIPAKGSPAQGSSYNFIDSTLLNRIPYFYLLEDVDFYGVSTFHGPASATPRWIYGIVK